MKHYARPHNAIVRFLGAAMVVLLVTAPASHARATADAPNPAARLIDALELHEGSIVAEMGAGSGARTLAIARHVGPTGHVYTSELGAANLDKLRKAIEAGGVQNVTVIEGAPTETNLPEACCDALFMEKVYHHFDDPAAMDASIFRSVKPGGRVAIVDFAAASEAARPQDRDTDGHHGVTPATVQAELEKAGFELVRIDQPDKSANRDFLVLMRKPLK